MPTCVHPVIDYVAPVFHLALPAYLSQELERVQNLTCFLVLISDLTSFFNA